jgi:hypothetical protein
LGRVQERDDEAVALQLGDGDPVGLEGLAQSGDDGVADIADGAGGREGGGEPLDAAHVVQTGAQFGGVGDGAHEPCWAALGGGQQVGAQPEPLVSAGRLEDAELQFPVADGHVVRLHGGHQRGKVLGHGHRQQGLDLAVERRGGQPEQIEHLVVDLDPPGVHGEAERAGGQVGRVVRQRGRRADDGVGEHPETGPVLGAEAVGALADGDQAAVVPQGQHGQRVVPRGQPPRVGAAGDLLRPQPARPPRAQRLGGRGAAGQGVAVAEPVQRPGHSRGLGQMQFTAARTR